MQINYKHCVSDWLTELLKGFQQYNKMGQEVFNFEHFLKNDLLTKI